MGQAIGDFLPSAVGVAISPLPIVAVVLMLVTPRGRVNGLLFVAGWCVGLGLVGAIMLSIAGGADATDGSGPATWVDVLFLILGMLLILVSARQWRGRPHGDEEPPTPKWMGALDRFTPAKPSSAGVVLSALNPKNLLLAPVVIALAMGDRSRPVLDGLKAWLARNNAVIMAVLMLIIGVKLIGNAISGFST